MFGLGWGEIVVIGIVALIAIGPKELPTVLRSMAQWMGKIRRMATEFQGQFHEALREAELTDLKKQAEDFTSDLSNFDPLADTKKELTDTANQIERTFDMPDPLKEADAAAAKEPGAAPVTAVEPAALPPIEIPMPDLLPSVTEKDFAIAEPVAPQESKAGETKKQAGGGA